MTADEAHQELWHSVPLERVENPLFYDAIFLPGGHGAMFDLPNNAKLQDIISRMFSAGAASIKSIALVENPLGMSPGFESASFSPAWAIANRCVAASA